MVSRRFQEKERQEREQAIAKANAALERRQEERARRAEQEYQRAIKAGGDVAAEAKWQRLYDQTLEETGSRYGLCQWDLANGQSGACTRRTADLFCHVHTRQLEREAAKRRAAAEESPSLNR